MKINNVLYLLRDDLENLPPSMSQVLTLCQIGCKVKVVTMHASEYIREFFKDQNIEFSTLKERKKIKGNTFNKLQNLFEYRNLVKKSVTSDQYDLLWVGSADTARYCKDLFINRAPMVLNIYELYDKNPEVIRAIKPIAQGAECVVVPEYNRAHILKVWLGLNKTPIIIPNKPCFPKVEIFPDAQKIVDDLRCINKKIVLYQGWIGKGRDITKVAEALNKLKNKDEYALVLLGSATAGDPIGEIKSIFNTTIHIPFLKPPQHLFVTELAHIGIATYDDSSLNNVFCAPNKIYEYAEKNVPILARDIPGLSNTVGKYKAGVCVNMDSVDEIAIAIQELDANYDEYRQSLEGFLNEYSVMDSIRDIIKSCEESNT